jgi:hypothetical protein
MYVLPQVIVYDGLTRQVRRTFSRFKDVAYSGCFRQDGKLLVAGGQSGIVQVRYKFVTCMSCDRCCYSQWFEVL